MLNPFKKNIYSNAGNIKKIFLNKSIITEILNKIKDILNISTHTQI